MSTANRVIKNTGFLYAKMGITMFISLYTTRLILNSLGASDFGIFNIVGGAISMLGFLNAAMASATQRFMSYSEGEGNREKQKSIFNVSFILHLGISIVVGISLLIAGYFFFNGILNIPQNRIFAAQVIYGSLIISTMFTVMTVPYDAAMNAHENMKYYAIVGIFESFLKLAVAFACVYTSYDKLIVYGILMAGIPLVSLTIMRIYCHKHYEECVIAPRTFWEMKLMKEMTSFAGWNLLGTMSVMISQYGLNIVLNIFHGTIANAAQGISSQVNGQLSVLGGAIKKSINPIITKSAGAQDQNMMIKATIWGTKIVFWGTSICFLPLLIDTNYILHLWLKQPPTYTLIFCRLLFSAYLIEQLTLFLPQVIFSIGKIRNCQIAFSLLNCSPIIITFLAFNFFNAPAYTLYVITLIIYVIRGYTIIYYANALCNISSKQYFKNVILRCSIAFLIPVFTGILIQHLLPESMLRLILLIIITTLEYCFIIYTIGSNSEEKKFYTQKIKSLLQKIKHHGN